MDVKRFDVTSGAEICPISQSADCMLIGHDVTHAAQFCHLPNCPIDPTPSCPLLSCEKGHDTSFSHVTNGLLIACSLFDAISLQPSPVLA